MVRLSRIQICAENESETEYQIIFLFIEKTSKEFMNK